MKKRSGFTLIELMVLIAIILTILAMIGTCIGLIIGACAAKNVIERDGLKGVGERFWRGTNAPAPTIEKFVTNSPTK